MNQWLTIKKDLFHNQLDIQNEKWCLPVIVVFILGCNGVLGVDERNNIPTWHLDGFGEGCKDKFLRFFDDDE